jgi:hypothetical protein
MSHEKVDEKMWANNGGYQGCQIELDSIRFSIKMLQKPFDSIQKMIRFDTNQPQQLLNLIRQQ